ncbi:MAG: hypothetical protein AAGC95_07160 [Pseudomonadota bacterium]
MPFDLFQMSSAAVGTIFAAVLAAMAALYLARKPMHEAIRTAFRAVAEALRLAAHGVASARKKIDLRNKEVLLSAGREAAERMTDREFERIADAVKRDVGGYPRLHQDMSETVRRLEEDYRKSVEAPPSPPGWAEAVSAVAATETKAEPVLRQVLESIHGSFERAQEEAAEDYRKDYKERHSRLDDMAPRWREVQKRLDEARVRVDAVLERARSVDAHMEKYKQIVAGTDKAAAALQSSALVQFFISGLVLAIAAGGAVINFHLIARPMAEMVGGTSLIAGFRTADIAALVIILVELSMGLFVMECLRITRLFPVIGALPDKLRQRMGYAAFAMLFALASVEAGLAYMRELLLHDELATAALLRGEAGGTAASGFLWITTAAQMGMGFILPFALTFVAIPLETFIHSLRAVIGWSASAAMMIFAFLLRFTAAAMRRLGEITVRLYDVLIFAPLWVETAFKTRASQPPVNEATDAAHGARAVMADIENRIAS